MSNSKHQAIVAAVKAALLAGTPLVGGRVYEGRELALPTGTASQINIFEEDSTPDSSWLTGAPVDWTTIVTVVIKARRTGADPAETVCDSIWCDVLARVTTDATLLGLVQMLTPGPLTRDRDEADTDVAAFTWQFTVMHRTANNTVT